MKFVKSIPFFLLFNAWAKEINPTTISISAIVFILCLPLCVFLILSLANYFSSGKNSPLTKKKPEYYHSTHQFRPYRSDNIEAGTDFADHSVENDEDDEDKPQAA